MRVLLEHGTIVRSRFVGRLCLIYLHLLYSAKRVLSSGVTVSRALSTGYEILPASGLHVAACRQAITKSLRVEVCCCVVHVLAASSVLTCTHQLIVDATRTSTSSSTATMIMISLTLLVNNVHSIEIILSQVHILTRLILHVERQLLYFVTIFIVHAASRNASRMNDLPLSLASRLAVIVTRERNLGVTLVGRDLVAVHGVHILRVLVVDVLLLPLSRLNQPCSLDLCLLSGARAPARDPLTVSAVAHPVVASTSWIRVEVVSCAGQRRQHVRLVDTRKHCATARLPCCSLGLQVLVLLALFLLFDVRTVTAMPLRTLLDLVLNGWPKSVLRPVLLLARQDALVEKLGVLLPSIKCVVANELVIRASLRATVASRLTVLTAAGCVPDAGSKIDCVVFDGLELIVFVNGLIVHIVLVIAYGIAFVKVCHLADSSPVLIVIRAASV